MGPLSNFPLGELAVKERIDQRERDAASRRPTATVYEAKQAAAGWPTRMTWFSLLTSRLRVAIGPGSIMRSAIRRLGRHERGSASESVMQPSELAPAAGPVDTARSRT